MNHGRATLALKNVPPPSAVMSNCALAKLAGTVIVQPYFVTPTGVTAAHAPLAPWRTWIFVALLIAMTASSAGWPGSRRREFCHSAAPPSPCGPR